MSIPRDDAVATPSLRSAEVAEGVGFEPTVGYPTLDFESSALNRTQPPFRNGDIVDLIFRDAIGRRIQYEASRAKLTRNG